MDLIATLQCEDKPGIVHAMTTAVLASDGNIIENQQFTDPTTNTFVMRTRFETNKPLADAKKILESGLGKFSPKLKVRSLTDKPKALVLVTKESHCLRDLLYLHDLDELPIEIPVVASNHEELRSLVESHEIPFIKLNGNDEVAIKDLVNKNQIDFIILARYMQILSEGLSAKLSGRCINIHHSFLPGFKGANPYKQAHTRGVKLIGATAHYVTSDLDEGPIIEQDVTRVTHGDTPEDLVRKGRDLERTVLSRALRYYLHDRVLINGATSVVFSD